MGRIVLPHRAIIMWLKWERHFREHSLCIITIWKQVSIFRGVAVLIAACGLAHILMKPLWELVVRLPLSVSFLVFVFLIHTPQIHRHPDTHIYYLFRWADTSWCMCEGQNLWRSDVSSLHVGSKDWTQVLRFDSNYLYPLIHLSIHSYPCNLCLWISLFADMADAWRWQ